MLSGLRPDRTNEGANQLTMIIGIGGDIFEIAQMKSSLAKDGQSLLDELFTADEQRYCRGKRYPERHLAARFAAKEAVSKALATGWAGDFRWKNVEVTNDASGQPRITVYGGLKEQLGSSRIMISLSHADLHVVAVAVIEDVS